ncbi:antirestriction protein ArdA [Virgibacillus dokdonensis]|uniref:Antirestriction protein ArdA n=1 Tax=Virgibacillus dokdonensis TaxID=302167 RepID=A0A2K9IZY0_9BACI|nr:antirestriction protein ArdA [Virgibacillus dokdonensis]AUJ24343.1 hypothetical protein A21D_01244 [Virgibacillus dokdonensis]
MSEVKIYIANLAAYNARELRGAWFTLPSIKRLFLKQFFIQNN